MEKVRGFVHFENKNIEEVREAFKDFNIPGMRYKFFNELIRLKRKFDMPGIFLDGEVDAQGKEDYSSEIVCMLRKKLKLSENIINCDVSSGVAGEDYIVHLKKGELNGKYIGIRILPPYPDMKVFEEIAFDLGYKIHARDILLRGVEKIVYRGKEIDKKCIDLISSTDFDIYRDSIEIGLGRANLKLEGYTLIDLLD